MILQEIEPKMYEPQEDTLQHGYILRTLQRFAGFFGLAVARFMLDTIPF